MIHALTLAALLLPAADRPTGDRRQTRSVTLAPHGMVATSHPLAAQAGLQILIDGGNAVDAAIAANAVLGVVEPMSNGLGGDLFAVVWDAKTEKLYGLNASGRSPKAISRELLVEKGLDMVPLNGPLSWSLPGCASGWDALHGRFGSMPVPEILAPARGYAVDGFPVTEVIAHYWSRSQRLLAATPGGRSAFLKEDGSVPRVGDRMTNFPLARTLERLAGNGLQSFYHGDVADEMVAYSDSAGGLFTAEDFHGHAAEWVEPVSTHYRGHTVWELPPNGQGIAALQILNLLEPHDVAGMGHNTPEFLHLFVEAKKLAFADRARFYADPAMAEVPTAELVSKAYAAERAKLIDPARAASGIPPGDPKLGAGDTIYLTVVDKDRNCVSLIQSTYYGWGSGHVPADLGFMWQNRGNLFTLEEGHPNVLEGGKRPFHTIIPAFVTKDGKPWLSFGVMGGDMQPQGHVQILVNMIDHGMNLQLAGDVPRVRHFGSAQPTGAAENEGGGFVALESGIGKDTAAKLEQMGHQVRFDRDAGSFGGYQAILLDHGNRMLRGASESRKDGAAVGY